MPRWEIQAFAVVVGRGGEVVAVVASHRLDDSNPVVRAQIRWSRSNLLRSGNEDRDVTSSTEHEAA